MRTPKNPWHDHWIQRPEGHYYPWRSKLSPLSGEDLYFDLVKQYASPDRDVLEAGCGYGRDALTLAPLCCSITAYDGLAECIDFAQATAQQQNICNATFLCANSSAKANAGQVSIPTDSKRFDLLISRRGPTNWLEDAQRVARRGAILIQLNPMERPIPAWNEELPPALRFPMPAPDSIRERIERRLALGGLELHSCWTFDVPEFFDDPEQFHLSRSLGQDEMPSFALVREDIERIFTRHATPQGLELRYRRFLWQAVVE